MTYFHVFEHFRSLHHLFTMHVYQNHFTICSLCLQQSLHHVCSQYMFIRITSPYFHHVCNNHFIIYSPYMFTRITSQYVHHVCLPLLLQHVFTMYVYHNYFTICCSPCMFTIITSPYIHHVCLP